MTRMRPSTDRSQVAVATGRRRRQSNAGPSSRAIWRATRSHCLLTIIISLDMDSEDERELAREDVVYERHGLQLKSNENFERPYRGSDVDACGPAGVSGCDIRAFRLFLSVIEGFSQGTGHLVAVRVHTDRTHAQGGLDLSGRSPRRYASLITRVFEFERDLEGASATIDAE
jgi:hypothetical protein